MVAVEKDIEVEQGVTFQLEVEVLESDGLTPRDLTAGYTGAMQIRSDADSDVVLGEADVTFDVGAVIATIPDTETLTMGWRIGRYDLRITDGSPAGSELLARGNARLVRRITRP